jgi:hypothetical protein
MVTVKAAKSMIEKTFIFASNSRVFIGTGSLISRSGRVYESWTLETSVLSFFSDKLSKDLRK